MKRVLISLVLILAIHTTCRAQLAGYALIDSLNRKLIAATDTNRAFLLIRMSEAYNSINPDTGLIRGNEALQLSEELKWQKGIALAYNAIAINYINKGDIGTALHYLMDALKINKERGDEQAVAINLGNIGNVYNMEKKFDKSYTYYEQALAINRKLGNKEKMATNLGNMGNVYSHFFDTSRIDTEAKAKNKQKTLDLYNDAIALFKEIGNKNGVARNMGNAGNIYNRDNDKTRAVDAYAAALKIYEEVGNNMHSAAMLVNIGSLYKEVAEDTSLSKNIGPYTNKDSLLLITKAIEYSEKAARLSKENGYLNILVSSYYHLCRLYAMKGDFKKAFSTSIYYTEIVDSLNRLNNEEQIAKLEAKNKAEQQEKEIEIQKLAVAKKRNTTWFLGIGIVLLLGVIVFIITERKKSEQLLLNILPAKIAARLKAKEHPIADQFMSASIMFIDIAGFTRFSADHEPKELVSMLNEIFTMFDVLAEKHGLEKIKTIGDCYMAVAGLPQPRRDHAIAAANMALDVKQAIKGYTTRNGTPVDFRIGLDCGPVVAGVIGTKKFIYDLWGDAVNMASRMESTGIKGEIHCTSNFKQEALIASKGKYSFGERGMTEIKGKGQVLTWLLYEYSEELITS